MMSPINQGITIDGPTSRDLDDAIFAEQVGDHLHIQVHIADVARLVPKGHELDALAHEHVASRYRARGTFPMLPPALSEGAGSLLPQKTRPVASLALDLWADTLEHAAPPTLRRGKLKSQARLYHAEVPEILQGDANPLKGLLFGLGRLADRLLERRRALGALALYDLNHGWVTTEEGALKQIDRDEATIGYVIVQELMILHNSEIARFCAEREIPILFRNHAARACAPDRSVLMEQIEAAVGLPPANLEALRGRLHLVMQRAAYGANLEGHYGLALPAYVHASSPIRRYADLITQRQIGAHLEGMPLPYTRQEIADLAGHINEHIEAEREAAHEFFKSQVDTKVAQAVVRGRAHNLSTKELSRAIKGALGQPEPPAALADVYMARLSAGDMPPLDLFQVLLQSPSGWADLRAAVISHLVKTPHVAVSLAAMAESILGWPAVEIQIAQSGPSHAPLFSADAVLELPDGRRLRVSVSGTTAKIAQQRAVLGLLAEAAGQVAPTWPEVTPSAALQTLLAQSPAFAIASANPIGALQEVCMAQRNPLPSYVSTANGGPSHAPVFSCTCTVGSISRTAQGATKQAAKQAAAADVFAALTAQPERTA